MMHLGGIPSLRHDTPGDGQHAGVQITKLFEHSDGHVLNIVEKLNREN